MALGKLGPEAFKQLNTRIIISKSIPDEKEEVNRQLTGTMRWFAVFTTISLCLAGWAALVAFVVKVPSDNHDPEWAKFLNVIVGVEICVAL
ncbi:3730_t:CDS:2 [Paraglomus occultum]|uniref:3730_t:CDS:1 n=1 Tax=Paraglomus occultum TaxID=144539 RepID=A0A9N9AYY4_9GLOM|nr:3730_t:CDS:2 [Paraglomus occultum]